MKTASPGGAAAQTWIDSPALDLFFCIGTSVAVLIPWLLRTRYGVMPGPILTWVAIIANGPHLVSTWTRVYLDRSERSRRPVVYWVMPVLIAAGVTWATLAGDPFLRGLRTVL